jgi:hypothetical protein
MEDTRQRALATELDAGTSYTATVICSTKFSDWVFKCMTREPGALCVVAPAACIAGATRA